MLPCTGLIHHVPHSASGDNCMRRYALSALWLSFAGVPGLLAAQGFGIYEQGTCAMGRAGTGVAAPCPDGSALFFNPAGLAGLKGGHATIGVTLINVDRKSTRLNSSHQIISYAVFCLKKKKK